MQRLEVSGAIRPIYGSLAAKRLIGCLLFRYVQLNWAGSLDGIATRYGLESTEIESR